MIWLCEIANSVIGKKGKLLEYWYLIANPKTRATWTHSYGNELGCLAQGMPGQAKGTDTIFIIPWYMVPKERAKDVTYSLITCLIRPEKIKEPNRTRLVMGGGQRPLPIQRRYANRQLTHHKAAHQQHNMNTRRKILHNGHQELLSVHANVLIRIHAVETIGHAGGHHRAVQVTRYCNPGRICLLRNLTGHVRASPSRDHCTGTLSQTVKGAQLLAKQDHAWTVDTRGATYYILPCYQQLWGQIRQQGPRPAPVTNGAKIL
jgi:hypothetical protein